jgi:hypothetical protein
MPIEFPAEILQPPALFANSIECRASQQAVRWFTVANDNKRSFVRAFLDFFILFSGISTASNLERTQGRPQQTRGMFLFGPR